MTNEKRDPNYLPDAPIYQLGRVPFTFVNCDEQWTADVGRLLPVYGGPLGLDEVLNVRTGCSKDLRDLVNHIVRRHLDCLWLDISCMRTADGRLVVIAGEQGTGKTTLALGLAISAGMKVVSSESLIIDHHSGQIIAFHSPFCLQKQALELVETCTGVVPKPLFEVNWSRKNEKWAPLDSYASELNEFEAKIDLAVFLEKTDTVGDTASEINPSQLLRKLLPTSNQLRIKGATDAMFGYIENASCLSLSAESSLQGRLESISNFFGIKLTFLETSKISRMCV